MAITRRQNEVLDFLSSFTQRNGYSPSYEEIAHGLGLRSLATVHKHITNLHNKGLLQRSYKLSARRRARRRETQAGRERLPLAGRIAAGLPGWKQWRTLGDHFTGRHHRQSRRLALQVRGESMRDEHIVDGDYVLVERTPTAHEGDIVVALVRGSETTLKRYYIEGAVVRLQPSNAEMDAIYVPAAQVAIQGRLCSACSGGIEPAPF